MNNEIIKEISKIFTDKYYKTYHLSAKYTIALSIEIIRNLDLEQYLKKDFFSVEEIIKTHNFSAQSQVPLKWMLNLLYENNLILCEDLNVIKRYSMRLNLPQDLNLKKISDEIINLDSSYEIFIKLMTFIAADYPDFIKGNKNGIEIVFSKDRDKLWDAYFSNKFNGYSPFNVIGAMILGHYVSISDHKFNILELGAGTGGGTEKNIEYILERKLEHKVSKYIFSDLSPYFLRSGNKKFLNYSQLNIDYELKKINFDNPINLQKIDEQSVDIVYAVNALHVARDLAKTINYISCILRPGGRFIVSELIREDSGNMLFQELIFNLLDSYQNVLTDYKTRPNCGFLTIPQWKRYFEEAKFNNIEATDNSLGQKNFFEKKILMVLSGSKT